VKEKKCEKTAEIGELSEVFPLKSKKVRKQATEDEENPAKRKGDSPENGGNNLCKRCISFLGKWCYHMHKLQEQHSWSNVQNRRN